MSLYTPWLCTLEYVRRHRGMRAVDTADNPLILDFIAEASAEFQGEAVFRTCMPYLASRKQNYQGSYILELDEDLLTVSSITNGDGSSMTTSTLMYRPPNDYPKWRIEWPYTSTPFIYTTQPQQAITVTGTWGYAPNYDAAWRATGITVPAGNISSGATSVALAAGQGASFEVGMYVKIDSEVIQVTAIATDTLTLSRGELGTTAAAHTAGVAIYKYQQLADIQGAVRDMVAYYYKTKDQAGGRVQVFQGGVLQVEDMDPRVRQTQARHSRKGIVVI